MSSTRRLALALLTLAVVTGVLAQTPRWHPIGPYAADAVAVAADPGQPHRVYAAARGEVYLSLDGGAHFAALPGVIETGPLALRSARSLAVLRSTAEVAVFPPPPPRLLVGMTNEGIYYSGDGGRTFAAGFSVDDNGPLPSTVWAIHPVPGRLDLAFLTTHALHRTTDGGATWRRVPTPTGSPFSKLAVLDDTGDVLLLSREDGVFRSVDAGSTWARLTDDLPDPPSQYIAFPARDEALAGVAYLAFPEVGTYRSGDLGLHWTRTGPGPGRIGGERLHARGGVLWYNDSARLSRSLDGGRSWQSVFEGSPLAVALDATTSRIYAGAGPNPRPESGVWRSDDAGATWLPPGDGIAAASTYFALIDSAGTVYAKQGTRLLARGESDQAWRDITPAGFAWPGFPPEDVVVLGARSLLMRGADGSLHRSDDAGVRWQVVGTGATAPLVAAEPGRPEILYGRTHQRSGLAAIITSTTLMKSVDGGRTWQSINAGLPAITYRLWAAGGNRLFALTSDGAWSSADGGGQWVRTVWSGPAALGIPPRVRSASADALDAGVLYAVTDQGMFRSADGGARFAHLGALPAPDATFVAAAPAPSTAGSMPILYVATSSQLQVHASRDGGATWQVVGAPVLDRPLASEMLASPKSAWTLHAASDRGMLQLHARSGVARAFEFHHPKFDHYFVTASRDEAEMIAVGGLPPWVPTGATWPVIAAATAGASPVCRFFSAAFAPKSSHFYTPFANECAAVRGYAEWQFEGYAFYLGLPIGLGSGTGLCPEDALSLYRLYNDGMSGAPNHRYTTSAVTLSEMVAAGWVFEGEAATRVFACIPR